MTVAFYTWAWMKGEWSCVRVFMPVRAMAELRGCSWEGGAEAG